MIDSKKLFKSIPYVVGFYFGDKVGYQYRIAEGITAADKMANIDIPNMFGFPLLSFNLQDIFVGLIACGALFLYVLYRDSTRKKLRPGEECGSARLGTATDIKPFINKHFRQNCILSKTEFLTMEERVKPWYMARNKNAIFYGGSGAGKTFSVLMPNLLQMHSSYVVIDPKGTLIQSCGWLIRKMGYKIRVFNTVNFNASMCYNPLAYIKKETDIQKLVTTLMENTKEPDEKGQDPFWPKAEKLLYNAIIGLIMEMEVSDKRNMLTMIDMIDAINVSDDEKCKVEILFEDWEEKHGKTYAVRQWHKFEKAAGKTKRSILASVGGRMSPFDIDTLREKMEFDELALDKIGDEKTVMFFIIDDSDTTFNFLVSMALSQMFNALKEKADRRGGHLKYHVRVLWDETYNTGQVPRLEHLIAQLRSRGISMWMFFQAKNQLVDLYGEKKAENIEANCDVKAFLGGNEYTSWKDWSELLGQETIDVLDQSDTFGATRSTGNSYKKSGKKLMAIEDIANMPGNKCLIKLKGVPPFYSDKYDCMNHPLFKYTSDFDKKYSFNLKKYLYEYRADFLFADAEFDHFEIDLSQDAS